MQGVKGIQAGWGVRDSGEECEQAGARSGGTPQVSFRNFGFSFCQWWSGKVRTVISTHQISFPFPPRHISQAPLECHVTTGLISKY